MKAIYNLSAALAALLLAACGNEEILENNESGNTGKVTMTFTAQTAQTRTQLANGNAVHWQADDAISMMPILVNANMSNDRFSIIEANGSGATFNGSTSEADNYLAVYPYQESVEGTLFADGTVFFNNLDLPTRQQAAHGTFAPGLNLSWAQATDGNYNLVFHNLCSLIKFRMTGEEVANVSSVTLVDSDTQNSVAGTMNITMDDGGGITNVTIIRGNDAVILTAPADGFKPDTDYYFTVLPYCGGKPFQSGFSLTFANKGNCRYTVTTANGMNGQNTAGRIVDLGTIALGAFDEYPVITNKELIEAVGNTVDWTKNDDGTVTVDDANRAAIEDVTLLYIDNKNLTDLSGIEYFTKLTILNCSVNQLTQLPVDGLTGLTSLYCSANQLTELDITSLSHLTDLFCGIQKDADGNGQYMTLYLTESQYQDRWCSTWQDLPANNRVNCEVLK